MTLRFNDGESFDTKGPLRLEHRYDGWYVIGNGMLLPVRDPIQGEETIKRMTSTMPYGKRA